MPVKISSNNRILPPNTRQSDVASRAVQEFLPAQQSKNYSATRVQGYEGLLYTRLTQGRRCTCQASHAKINSRLGLDGKAKPGVINELLTGEMQFSVTPYGQTRNIKDNPNANVTSPNAPINKNQGVFDVVGNNEDYDTVRVPGGKGFGDNGPVDTEFDIDALVGEFDASTAGVTDVYCGICFGQGFVGGYSAFHSTRIIRTVDEVDLGASTIDVRKQPWSATGTNFSFTLVLPYGAIGVDVFRVMNNATPVAANFTIDGAPANVVSIVAKCDGKPHSIGVTLLDLGQRSNPFEWTHLELQFITSDQSAFFELPRTNQGSDTSLLNQTEPFNIVLSSNVPLLSSQDIITESTFGRALIVQNSNDWNTRNRDVLGWECQVRVLQPPELFNILPRRGRVLTKAPTPYMQHDNQTGNRRT